MFRWLKLCLENVRLRAESKRLAKEFERATGKPLRLSRQELQRLANASNGIDPEILRKQSVLHPDDIELLIELIHSDDNS